jgi:hypothetical protein
LEKSVIGMQDIRDLVEPMLAGQVAVSEETNKAR